MRKHCALVLLLSALALTSQAGRFCSRRVVPVVVVAEAEKEAPQPVAIPDRNPVNKTDKNVSLDFSLEDGSEKNVLWKAKLGKVSYAGPVFGKGKVLVATNNEKPRDAKITEDAGVIMCFDQKTGDFLWQMVHEKLPDDSQNYPHQGIASTPCVDGDHVYYVSNRCELVCLDINGDKANKGKAKVVWTLDMIKELKVFPCQLANSSPLVVGDLVYAVTGNGVDVGQDPWVLPSPNAPSFIAVNKKDGKVKWKDASPGKNIMEGQWTSPTYAKPKDGPAQVIFPGGDGWLYSFKPENGELIWKFNCNPKDAVYNPKNKRISEKAYFLAAPVVYEDRVYIGLGTNPDDGPGPGHFWCIDVTKKGDVSPKDEKFNPKDPKNKDSALVWHFGGKIDPKPERGREVKFGRTISTASIHDGLVYIAELDGYFHCLDAKTGEQYYVVDLQAGVWASAYCVDGKVFLGNEDGDLHVYEQGKKMKRLEKITVGPPIKTPVKVVDGVLYVLTDSYLYAVGKK